MIRFEKKADPQPLPGKPEDKLFDEMREGAVEERKKSATGGTRRRPRQATEDGRLI
ncbi:hypothetical protein J2046_005794 [Rhizobium petrolearium]|uniref:hypothetical protein n=1 Tax=Neorhizobium petrolearium TaxID=515361 RepID=UPI001AE3861B|nr:hypothetical protein [Neorhizobium petrolearium]MBP1847510.1 hypothetical protein [Neorhizobium petrolearium]